MTMSSVNIYSEGDHLFDTSSLRVTSESERWAINISASTLCVNKAVGRVEEEMSELACHQEELQRPIL